MKRSQGIMQALVFFLCLSVLPCPAQHDSSQLILPEHLVYKGAFRLPDNTTGSQYNWAYGLGAMTFCSKGDPNGPVDGYPGSIYASGHEYEQYVGEMSVPVPVKSTNLNALNRAGTLQNFHDINQGLYVSEYKYFEMLYLPKQGSQTTDKIHIAWNNWYNVSDGDADRYGWCELNLSNPNTQGAWNLGTINPHSVADYMFEIPQAWADAHTPGKRIITGKYRSGGCDDGGVRTGGGPSMHAYGPWNQGNPPSPGTVLDVTTLLYYNGHLWQGPNGENPSVKDGWKGGAWLTCGNRSAIVLAGVKGLGEDFYGISPSGCDGKGYHALGGYVPIMMFYDPDDIAAVADGAKETYEPQPYAVLNCGQYAFKPYDICSAGFGGAGYDREHGLLYVAEPFVDGSSQDKPVIHVFSIDTTVVAAVESHSAIASQNVSLQVFPNPFNPATMITISGHKSRITKCAIYNAKGEFVANLMNSIHCLSSGIRNSVKWDASNLPSGMYVLQVTAGSEVVSERLVLIR